MAQINGRESLLYLKLTERQEQTKKQVNFIRFINPKKYGIFFQQVKKIKFLSSILDPAVRSHEKHGIKYTVFMV